METLRSPKHLTGPRHRLSRADVPRLVRGPARRRGLAASLQDRHVGLARLPAVGARHRADRHRERCRGDEHRSGSGPSCASSCVGASGSETVYARRVVLAGGRDGSGAPFAPPFPSLARARTGGARSRVPLLPTDIDFARFRGGKVGVLGASASAFDNAAVALEAGAGQARLFSRRAHLPQINKSKWTVFPGFFHGFAELDDARRWDIYSYILSRGRAAAARVGAALRPPCRLRHPLRRAMARCRPRRGGRRRRHDQGALSLRCRRPGDRLLGRPGATAGACSPPRQDRALVAIASRRTRPRAIPSARAFPISVPASSSSSGSRGAAPGLGHIHCFNAGATMSHGGACRRHPRPRPTVPTVSRARSRRACSAAEHRYAASRPRGPRRPRARAHPLLRETLSDLAPHPAITALLPTMPGRGEPSPCDASLRSTNSRRSWPQNSSPAMT